MLFSTCIDLTYFYYVLYETRTTCGHFDTFFLQIPVYVMEECCIFSSPSLAVAGEHGKRHAMPAHNMQAVHDWLNPQSLGTISEVGSIANVALNSTCLINYQKITR